MTRGELFGMDRIATPSTYLIRSFIILSLIVALELDVDLKLIVLFMLCMKLVAELLILVILGLTSLVKKLDESMYEKVEGSA